MVHDLLTTKSPIEFIQKTNDVELWIKRDDLIDPKVSGNKLYKLFYNLNQAAKIGKTQILTFGGAYSNHIAATARMCKLKGFGCIGIIRGEEASPLNPTLKQAEDDGMELLFISRSKYREKENPEYISDLERQFPNALIVPEGGANRAGVMGASAMLNAETDRFDYVVTAVGTGTTAAGLLLRGGNQKIVGIPIHKHINVLEEYAHLDDEVGKELGRYLPLSNHHLGGYAKWNQELIAFMTTFYSDHGIKLDPIYTGKALLGMVKEIESGTYESGSKILFIHTGGLQGIAGFEQRHSLKIY